MKRTPTLKKRLSGKIAKLEGAQFEGILTPVCNRDQITLIRIPDGCKQVKIPFAPFFRLIRIKSPFDFILAKNGEALCLDCKSVKGSKFPHSFINQDQIGHLERLSKQGIRSGYLVRFREIDRIVFFDVKTITLLKPRDSLNLSMGFDLGCFNEFSFKKLFSNSSIQHSGSYTDITLKVPMSPWD